VRRRFSTAHRDDLPAGLRERPNLRLLKLLWDYRREGRRSIERQLAAASAAGVNVLELRTPRALEQLLEAVPPSAAAE
jgi:hypothetical protein